MNKPIHNKGGKRAGAGRPKGTGQYGTYGQDTTVIRVPTCIVERIKEIALALVHGQEIRVKNGEFTASTASLDMRDRFPR